MKCIIYVVVTISLLSICGCNYRGSSSTTEESFSNSKLFELLKKYQEKDDSLYLDPDTEESVSELPKFNFSIDFFHIGEFDYMVISGIRSCSYVFAESIKKQSKFFLGYASYDDYNLTFYNHSDKKSNSVQEILMNVKFQDPSDFITNNASPGSYIYDPYYVVYKLQYKGNPVFIEEGSDVRIFKLMSPL